MVPARPTAVTGEVRRAAAGGIGGEGGLVAAFAGVGVLAQHLPDLAGGQDAVDEDVAAGELVGDLLECAHGDPAGAGVAAAGVADLAGDAAGVQREGDENVVGLGGRGGAVQQLLVGGPGGRLR